MALISRTPSVRTFSTAWSSEFSKAVKTAAGKDGRLSKSEAKKIATPFRDNAENYFQATGKQSVSVSVLETSAKAYVESTARRAAGTDGRLSAADAKKLPADLAADFAWLQGVTEAPASTIADLKAKLDPLLKGITMPSETDGTLLFISGGKLPAGPITEQTVRTQLAAQHDKLFPQTMNVLLTPQEFALATRQPVEERNAHDWLTDYATVQDPNDAFYVENSRRFGELQKAMESELTDMKVFRFGEIEISTLVVGRTRSGELAGFVTGVVET